MPLNDLQKKEYLASYIRMLSDEKVKDIIEKENRSGIDHVMMGIIIGILYKNIMVIGRATNGWHRHQLNTDNLFDGPDRIFDFPEILTKIITDYGISKGFWKILHGIFEPIFHENWEQYLAYTNYCKLAQGIYNPSNPLAEAQRSHAIKIIDLDIKTTNAKNILILTGCNVKNLFGYYTNPLMTHLLGEDWKSKKIDEKKWGESPRWRKDWLAQVYKKDNRTIILSEHPDRKFKYDDNHIMTITELLYKHGNL